MDRGRITKEKKGMSQRPRQRKRFRDRDPVEVH